jgi:hypothetical protein
MEDYKYCPHCDDVVAPRTFRLHKSLYPAQAKGVKRYVIFNMTLILLINIWFTCLKDFNA